MRAGRGASGRSPIDRIIASARSHVPSETERAYYQELIDALAARRRALGWTQAELDRRLGVTDHQVAKWESFARLPGAFMMMCWALALGVRLEARKDEA